VIRIAVGRGGSGCSGPAPRDACLRKRRIGLAGIAWLVAALLAPGPASPEAAGDATPASAAEVLNRAFERRYEVDLTSVIDLVMRNESGQERRRRFHAMSKVIDDRLHSIGRLTEPEYLRGMTVLTIEATDRGHDAFLYLPSLDRVRRVSTAQRGDAFFGTDVTYEDLERQRSDEYDLAPLRAERYAGEEVWVIEGRPLRRYNYARARFTIARTDLAILEVQYFKRGAAEPFRVITAPRASVVTQDGHAVPTRIYVTNRTTGTTTEVVISELRINPKIDDRAFSLQALESQRPIPVGR
jgi:hypothetical protein